MTFPALSPNSRTYTPGVMPQAQHVTQSGSVTGFRRAGRIARQRLTLGFKSLTETQVDLIKDHYIDRKGTFDTFFLSNEVWSGYLAPPVSLFSNTAWRYAGPPKITDGIFERWSVEVELDSYQLLQGDLVVNPPGGDNSSSAALAATATYIFDAEAASATPARSVTINSGAS